jgi:biopolymer transport protein ExbD
MAITHGGFKRKSKVASEIPDSSLADIAFLLLIFFMVTTVFRKEQQRDIVQPDAQATQRVDEKRKNILHLWVEQDGTIYINDAITPVEAIAGLVGPLYEQTDRRLVSRSVRTGMFRTGRSTRSRKGCATVALCV